MKIYRFSRIKASIFIVLGLICSGILLFDGNSLSFLQKTILILGAIVMPGVYLLILRQAIIIEETGISMANVSLDNNRIKYLKRLTWPEVDKVLQVAELIFKVYPKINLYEGDKYSSNNSIRLRISKNFDNYGEILKEIIQRAKNAQIDDRVRQAVVEWDQKRKIKEKR